MLHLYDTRTRTAQDISPMDGKTLRFYCCGPTVYGPAHIGNFRTFVMQDVFRRVLELGGVPTTHIRNLTDVDDKTIRDSQKAGVSLAEFTAGWADLFHRDCAALNCLPPHAEPSAVGHIPEQIRMVQTLVEKGHAYVSEDGSVYFRISSFPEYGRLSHLDERELDLGKTANARSNADEYEKDSVADFVLWKSRRPEDGNNFWPSPWGEGRPGWHLECSAMIHKYFGNDFDLHSGGVDLVFPHHENEVAQSRCACGGGFARLWFHITHLLVDGGKMSKSLGNVVNPDDVVNEYGADTLRLYEMFIGDFEKAAPWNTNSIKGCKRFLDRIWALSEKQVEGEGYRPAMGKTRESLFSMLTSRGVVWEGARVLDLFAGTGSISYEFASRGARSVTSVEINAVHYNFIRQTAVSDNGGATKAEYELLLQLLNPFVPHMTEELWQQMGHTDTLAYHEWPKYDEAKCVEQTIEIAVQVNGKVKARLNVAANIESADAIAAAKADPAVAEAIAGKTIAREIYVKGRLVNIAVKG